MAIHTKAFDNDLRGAWLVSPALQAVIESALQAGLSALRICQDLICDHAFTGGYHSVQRFVRQLLQTQPVPFVRMEVEPGTEARWILVRGVGAGGRQAEAASFVSDSFEPARKGYTPL